MKSPIDDLLDSLNIKKGDELYSLIRKQEKMFLRQVFNAGRDYGIDLVMSTEWAENPKKPNFEQWYKTKFS